ncbi:hypothetical protein ILYODFUR_010296 [Ilyodon furcidens]|uniref:Uncharacterized protein n=1 Tax=Ilyodon furcidens TaxID=33524 RepID=A0ABV0VFL0_9TELE
MSSSAGNRPVPSLFHLTTSVVHTHTHTHKHLRRHTSKQTHTGNTHATWLPSFGQQMWQSRCCAKQPGPDVWPGLSSSQTLFPLFFPPSPTQCSPPPCLSSTPPSLFNTPHP